MSADALILVLVTLLQAVLSVLMLSSFSDSVCDFVCVLFFSFLGNYESF